MPEPERSGASTAALARAYQLQALLYEVEECAVAVSPEEMAALLATQQAGAESEAFPLTRAWLDAVRVAQARRHPATRPFTPRPLHLTARGAARAD